MNKLGWNTRSVPDIFTQKWGWPLIKVTMKLPFPQKTYIEQQSREQWGDYRNPPPPPQTTVWSSPTLEGLLPDVRGNHSFLSQTRYWLGLNLTRGRLRQRDWLLGSSQYYRYLQHRYLHYTESGVRQHGSLYCWLAHTAGSLYCVCCCIT